jgi:hypothetical protein
MKRILALLLGAAIVVTGAVPAIAATSSDTASLSVDVPVNISLTFTDDVENFGNVLPGASASVLSALDYTVVTNAPLGFFVDVSQTTAGNPNAVFGIRKNGSTNGYELATGPAGGAVVNNWRTSAGPGTFNYEDDANVAISMSGAGSYSMTLSYLATTN